MLIETFNIPTKYSKINLKLSSYQHEVVGGVLFIGTPCTYCHFYFTFVESYIRGVHSIVLLLKEIVLHHNASNLLVQFIFCRCACCISGFVIRDRPNLISATTKNGAKTHPSVSVVTESILKLTAHSWP